MEVPGNWESRGLPDFDGVVWFTRALDWPQGSQPTGLTLGRVSSTSEVWINGLPVTPQPAAGAGAPAAGGRGFVPPTYELPAGTLRPGRNTITVRIQNIRGDGGFLSTPDAMYVQAGETKMPLAGTWKYRVERQTNAGALYTRPGELAAHLAFTDSGGAGSGALPPPASQAPDVTLRLGVLPGQLKFDLGELTVAPGQLVEIVFVNSDQMQHNFLLGTSGSLDEIGVAADKLAQSPNALAQQYVPEMPQVLFATKLVDPGQTLTFQFRAPAQQGQYPYVCTFPGHWRLMNGVLRVVAPAGRGRGGAASLE
jgi:plastocyanin